MTYDARAELYRAAVQASALCGHLLAQHDLPGFLQDIESAHAVGPILDPTLYRAKVEAMEQDRALLEAALPLWKLARALAPKERKD